MHEKASFAWELSPGLIVFWDNRGSNHLKLRLNFIGVQHCKGPALSAATDWRRSGEGAGGRGMALKVEEMEDALPDGLASKGVRNRHTLGDHSCAAMLALDGLS
jgi:hypothetical protein